MILSSPTEPPELAEAVSAVRSSKTEQHGVDFLVFGTEYIVGIQRKRFPDDLQASFGDGRLYEQVHKGRHLDHRIVLLEGRGKWTNDGELISDWGRPVTRAAIWNLASSLTYQFGIGFAWVDNMDQTADYIRATAGWADKKHKSLDTRPGPTTRGWGIGTRDWQSHVLQGFPGVGPELADRIIDECGGLPIRWDDDAEERLAGVRGLGKKKIGKLMGVLA